jgi:hypothetical protein
MFWIVMVLVAALILSLGCNVKQEFELETLRAENDELVDALAMLQVRTETRSTGDPRELMRQRHLAEAKAVIDSAPPPKETKCAGP